MKFLTVLSLSAFASVNAFDLLQLQKKDTCNTAPCLRAGQAIINRCGDRGTSNFQCLCHDMPDSFFEDLHECADNCDDSTDNDSDIDSPSEFRSIYCELASETIFVSGFGGFGGFGGFTGIGTDLVFGSATVGTGATTTGTATSATTGATDTTRTRTSGSSTSESKTTGSGTTKSETTAGNSASAEAETTGETTTTAGGTKSMFPIWHWLRRSLFSFCNVFLSMYANYFIYYPDF
ncbi:putative GPI-anchored adhesin-like protein PGA28 [Candida viswanathii]|uniref:Putative GPI-anchored adhesin-like protein PGA28 n=1 Tax=Candida viswanathii TaxID=5486 RepID=A0A367YIH3_9ASCO|nr:putative GPI-anchored adhesin-like protein PGA28 [Candida viswanathii]